jgi:hypothetical protein
LTHRQRSVSRVRKCYGLRYGASHRYTAKGHARRADSQLRLRSSSNSRQGDHQGRTRRIAGNRNASSRASCGGRCEFCGKRCALSRRQRHCSQTGDAESSSRCAALRNCHAARSRVLQSYADRSTGADKQAAKIDARWIRGQTALHACPAQCDRHRRIARGAGDKDAPRSGANSGRRKLRCKGGAVTRRQCQRNG